MPRGRPPKVEHVRDDFLKHLASATSLVASARKLETVNTTATQSRLHSKHVRRVIELAFMGIVSSWEEFLEQTLVRYLCGAKSKGFLSLRLSRCKSIHHAYQLLSSDPDYEPSKRFLNWNSPEQVVKKAALFLSGGGTYSNALTTYKEALLYATRIRNRVAHSSSKASSQFIETAKTLLQSSRLTQGYRVGDLLLTSPKNVANIPLGKSTYFDAYVQLFEQLAKSIVP